MRAVSKQSSDAPPVRKWGGVWGARIGWMLIGATVSAAIGLIVPKLAQDSSMPPAGRRLVGPVVEGTKTKSNNTLRRKTTATVNAEHQKQLMEILKNGGPLFRLQERVQDWSATASAAELVDVLEDVEQWPELKPDQASGIVVTLLNRLARKDGAAAAELAELLVPMQASEDDYRHTVYASWLAESPSAALEHIFVHRAAESDENHEFFARMFEQLKETDPDYALAVAETMARSGHRFFSEFGKSQRAEVFESSLEGRATMEFLNEWVAKGSYTADEIAELKGRLVKWVVQNEDDPQHLAKLMDQGAPVPEYLRWDALRLMAGNDVARATNFLLSQTDSAQRVEELNHILRVQADMRDESPGLQAQTTNWLMSGYQGADRQTLLMEASTKLRESDLGLAWKAASAMANDDQRFTATYAVGFDWLAKDSTTARANLPRDLVERYDLIMELYSVATTGFPPDVKLNLNFNRDQTR